MGNWEIASENYKRALELDPNDGPSKTVFKYIMDNGCKCPHNWEGYRRLTSK